MWEMFNTIAGNIGVSFEVAILLLLLIGSLIFFAKDTILGLIMLMFFSAGVFVWFYQAGLNYSYFIVLFFMSLVVLSLTLFLVRKSVNRGAII